MPLPRYTPLRREKPRKPLNAIGAGTLRKQSVRRASYSSVALRAKGRCELCEANVEANGQRLDPHHTFGRGHLPGIPAEICEHPELILGICRSCHDSIHSGDIELQDEARRIAVEQLIGPIFGDDPLTTLRRWIREEW